ncbi:hypothetical protein [Burkholderia sp. ABCPW 111]|uniref:hypothetical protein n=1 Tax=Burkholderia sp. ABCPW 111 TaxID=1820025 RepID=UPI000530CFAC|nr:hypothetical protein [Burkholderia sp. ABCPW 111]KGR93892.1 hypothetical protein X946_5540 [Burkholderia sp. ABCPW 111]
MNIELDAKTTEMLIELTKRRKNSLLARGGSIEACATILVKQMIATEYLEEMADPSITSLADLVKGR